ncbi:hypothetical protein E2C01_088526 [Portunus trituberculatus]|uniref:Uncharacterized protein n=1 Tax=Portunus trituberculatus TaxID=210409 RepID=A0A5B7J9H9_PORTR|nr:hypothetical protein [Portunus trituberculatus]
MYSALKEGHVDSRLFNGSECVARRLVVVVYVVVAVAAAGASGARRKEHIGRGAQAGLRQ